jgi:hypothetical protein
MGPWISSTIIRCSPSHMHPTSDNKHRDVECRGCSPGVVVRVSHVGYQDARCTVMNVSESDMGQAQI